MEFENCIDMGKLESVLSDMGYSGDEQSKIRRYIRSFRFPKTITQDYVKISAKVKAIFWDGTNFDAVKAFLNVPTLNVDSDQNLIFSIDNLNFRYPKDSYIVLSKSHTIDTIENISKDFFEKQFLHI